MTVRLLRRHRLAFAHSADGHTGIPKELLNHMKRSLALILTLASGFALSAAAQTPAAPAAQRRTRQNRRHRLPGGRGPNQRRPAQLRRPAEEVRSPPPAAQGPERRNRQPDQAVAGRSRQLTPAEQQSKATAIDTKKKQLDRDAQDAQNDFSQEMQDVYNALASKVYDVMQTYAELQGYTLVLDVSQQQSPVLYAATATNITKDIIDAYNQSQAFPRRRPAPLERSGCAQADSMHPRLIRLPRQPTKTAASDRSHSEHESLARRGFRAAMQASRRQSKCEWISRPPGLVLAIRSCGKICGLLSEIGWLNAIFCTCQAAFHSANRLSPYLSIGNLHENSLCAPNPGPRSQVSHLPSFPQFQMNTR